MSLTYNTAFGYVFNCFDLNKVIYHLSDVAFIHTLIIMKVTQNVSSEDFDCHTDSMTVSLENESLKSFLIGLYFLLAVRIDPCEM